MFHGSCSTFTHCMYTIGNCQTANQWNLIQRSWQSWAKFSRMPLLHSQKQVHWADFSRRPTAFRVEYSCLSILNGETKRYRFFFIYYYRCSLTTLGSKVAPDLTATRATRESTTSQPFLKAKECQHFICLQWFCDTAPQESENYAALVIDSDIYSVDFFAKCWNVGLRSSRARCIAGDGWHLD